jgi:hypothetical protein
MEIETDARVLKRSIEDADSEDPIPKKPRRTRRTEIELLESTDIILSVSGMLNRREPVELVLSPEIAGHILDYVMPYEEEDALQQLRAWRCDIIQLKDLKETRQREQADAWTAFVSFVTTKGDKVYPFEACGAQPNRDDWQTVHILPPAHGQLTVKTEQQLVRSSSGEITTVTSCSFPNIATRRIFAAADILFHFTRFRRNIIGYLDDTVKPLLFDRKCSLRSDARSNAYILSQLSSFHSEHFDNLTRTGVTLMCSKSCTCASALACVYKFSPNCLETLYCAMCLNWVDVIPAFLQGRPSSQFKFTFVGHIWATKMIKCGVCKPKKY